MKKKKRIIHLKTSEPPKPLSIAEKAKMMGGPAKKDNNANSNKFNMNNNINNNNKNNNINITNKNNNINNNINRNVNNNINNNINNNNNANTKPLSKFEQMKRMMENRGVRPGPRPSAQFNPNFKFGNLGVNNNNKGIIEEKSDKEKTGYDPAKDLEKKLDNIVVQKDKKKKKKPNFQG